MSNVPDLKTIENTKVQWNQKQRVMPSYQVKPDSNTNDALISAGKKSSLIKRTTTIKSSRVVIKKRVKRLLDIRWLLPIRIHHMMLANRRIIWYLLLLFLCATFCLLSDIDKGNAVCNNNKMYAAKIKQRIFGECVCVCEFRVACVIFSGQFFDWFRARWQSNINETNDNEKITFR